MAATIIRLQSIAFNTFREAVRQKFFNFLLIFSVGLILSSHFFRQFDFGGSELKFIADFGWGGIVLFGSVLSIVATAQLFFSEIENRTALTLLAKPVARWEFLVGKFAGIFLLLAIFAGVMVVLLGLVLFWRETTLMGLRPDDFPDGRHVSYGGMLVMGFLQLLKFGILVAITMFISSFSNTNLFSVVVAFFVMLICQLQYIARDHWSDIEWLPLRYFVGFLGSVFPNFQLFNVGDFLMFAEGYALTSGAVVRIILYGLVYIVFFNFLSVWSFRKREI